MSAGRIWPAEWKDLEDPVSGVPLRQLTDYKGHSHHRYFTNPGWFAGGRKLLFGDGRPYIRLWRWNGEAFDGPRILAEHRSSMHIQKAHPHPRFSPDGRYVVFTSDRSGYCNVYQVAVPDFESLPRTET